ncbi:RidA family protein [Oryzicola mucosus]|uniref:RidA family protein n=1 Tax=Oryzicola mucosus TaxID=2767425 RepID=A0A8J6PZU3_9HYPH|nr:RidA family protein [Oryzicola mucosus]MBD0417437.1 RidA family protein [Oryzicola mucosus]
MDIERIEPGQRSSAAVIFGDFIFISGQVGTPGTTVAEQTRQILARIDDLLGQSNSDRSRILQAVIWLADISTFDEMNSVWMEWIPQGRAPARATGESRLVTPEYAVEIYVTAARSK